MKLLIYILTFNCLISISGIPKNYLKKIDKEVFSIFDIATYEKEPVTIPQEMLDQMTSDFDENGLFKIVQGEEHLGYFYFGTAPSKADDFDFVVIFDRELIIKKIKILAYREDYGGEISSKRWLRQFNGLTTSNSIDYGTEVIGISGATISARSMTIAVNDLLSNLSKMSL